MSTCGISLSSTRTSTYSTFTRIQYMYVCIIWLYIIYEYYLYVNLPARMYGTLCTRMFGNVYLQIQNVFLKIHQICCKAIFDPWQAAFSAIFGSFPRACPLHIRRSYYDQEGPSGKVSRVLCSAFSTRSQSPTP